MPETPIQQLCTIVEVARVNPHAVSLTLAAGEMRARPGQFVHIKCGDGTLLRRPISVCTTQEAAPQNLMRIVFEERGEGTRWLARRTAGERLDVLGPLGSGFAPAPEGNYLLVGGGIGVPPLLGCAQAAPGRCTAVLGFRSADRVMLTEAFAAYCREVVLFSDDGSIGTQGFVDAGMRTILAKENNFTGVLACGPKAMLKAVARVAAEFSLPCQVSMEERMGCGVGACLVCACKMGDGRYRHVCKDGPVFAAGEVDWNE